MSDDHVVGASAASAAAAPASALTAAGNLLRAARLEQGLHIAALATAIKVTPAKLQALEDGRLADLPDLTFARALALTVCRHLKIDPAPVLAQLPGAADGGLERVDGGLNTPFRDRPGQTDPAMWLPWRRPLPWLVALLLLLAAAFVLVPMRAELLAPAAAPPPGPAPLMPPVAEPAAPGDVPATAASAPALTMLSADPRASAASGAGQGTAAAAAAAAASVPRSAASLPAAPASTTAIADNAVLHATQDSWVQVTDAGGQTLTSRLIPAGETVEFTGKLPLKLRIGNARGTELRFRGQPVDLTGAARDNIATLTLP